MAARFVRLLAVAASVALGALPRAAAQGRFEVPVECGSELEFRQEVARVLGRAALPTSAPVLSIGRADAAGEYRLRLELDGQARELRDRDCRTLLRSAVVIVAAAAREAESVPEVAEPPLPSPAVKPSPPPVKPSPASATPLVPAAPAPAPPASAVVDETPRSPAAYGVHLGAGLASGLVPGLGVVLLAGASLEAAPFGAVFSLRYAPSRTATNQGRGVDVESVGVRVEGVFHLLEPLELAVGLEADRLFGKGTAGVSGRESSAAWRLAPSLGLNLLPWPQAQPRFELGVSAQLALVRPRFVVEGFGDLYRVPVLGADAIIRGSWFFR